MPVTKIRVYGQRELLSLVKQGKVPGCRLILIGNPRWFWAKPAEDEMIPAEFRGYFSSILHLQFFDALTKDHLRPGVPRRIPELRDLKRVRRWFHKGDSGEEEIIVSCWAGVSRSPAVALGLLFMIHGREDLAIDKLLEVRPHARPHPQIVRFWDKLLGSRLAESNEEFRRQQLLQLREEIRRVSVWNPVMELGDSDEFLPRKEGK